MKQTIEIYLLDDDPVFLQTYSRGLNEYLQKRSELFQIHSFTNGEALLAQAAAAERIDLLIVDICLGADTITGLGVASQLRSRFPDCSIIYLTAYLEYATEIYETRPLYFIIKEEFQKRLPVAMELFFQQQLEKQTSIIVSTGRTEAVVRLHDLIYCEHIGRKTKLVCTDRQILVPDSIDELASKLPANRFIVCHKGYIVNFNYVVTYRRHIAVLSTGQELPISRARYDAFRAAYANQLAEGMC